MKYNDLGINKSHKERMNKILLPVLEDYSYYKRDLKREKNSIILNYEKNYNQPLQLIPYESIQADLNKRKVKLDIEKYDQHLEDRIKYNKLKFSVDEMRYEINRNNYKKEKRMEMIMAENNLFFHPQFSQFMIHPTKIKQIENHYNKDYYAWWDKYYNNYCIELGRNPYEDKDEIEVGKPAYEKKEIIIKQEVRQFVKKEEKESVKSKTPVIHTPVSIHSDFKREPKKANQKHWKKLIAFMNIALYYFTHFRLSKKRHIRNKEIDDHRKSLKHDQESIIKWFKKIQKTFIDELLTFSDINLAFNNFSGSLKLHELGEKTVSLLKLVVRNVLAATIKGNEIPEEVLQALNYFCLNKSYQAKKLLSTFEVFRLDFLVNGSIINLTETTIAMLMVFFVFIKTFVHRILLKIHDHYPEFKNYKYISLSMKYFSSVLVYLVEDTFRDKPKKQKNIIIYLNYIKNYKIKVPEIMAIKDDKILNNDSIEYDDINEFSVGLVPRESISNFFELYKDECEEIKKYLRQWGVQMGMYIRRKYFNKNLKD